MMGAAAEGSMAEGAELQRSVEQEQTVVEIPSTFNGVVHKLTPIAPVSHPRDTAVNPTDFCGTITYAMKLN